MRKRVNMSSKVRLEKVEKLIFMQSKSGKMFYLGLKIHYWTMKLHTGSQNLRICE